MRGGLVYMDRLVRERPHVSGVVSATRGNHGQSLAFAGRAYGRAVTILVPHGNSVEKNAAMRALGAEVIEFGDDFQAARERSIEVASERELEPVPPFHPDLVLGVATYARELFDAAGRLDTVYVPVGMGSGINALIAVRDLLGLDTQIVGVVSENAPSTLLSFERGEVVTTQAAATFVDGVATRSPTRFRSRESSPERPASSRCPTMRLPRRCGSSSARLTTSRSPLVPSGSQVFSRNHSNDVADAARSSCAAATSTRPSSTRCSRGATPSP